MLTLIRSSALMVAVAVMTPIGAGGALAEKANEPWLKTAEARVITASLWKEQLVRFKAAPSQVKEACSTVATKPYLASRYVAQSLRDCLDRHTTTN